MPRPSRLHSQHTKDAILPGRGSARANAALLGIGRAITDNTDAPVTPPD
jgi:hypothetical protein